MFKRHFTFEPVSNVPVYVIYVAKLSSFEKYSTNYLFLVTENGSLPELSFGLVTLR